MANKDAYADAVKKVRDGKANQHDLALVKKQASNAGSWGRDARDALKGK